MRCQSTILRHLGEAVAAQGEYPWVLRLLQEGVALARQCGEYAQLRVLQRLQDTVFYTLGKDDATAA